MFTPSGRPTIYSLILKSNPDLLPLPPQNSPTNSASESDSDSVSSCSDTQAAESLVDENDSFTIVTTRLSPWCPINATPTASSLTISLFGVHNDQVIFTSPVINSLGNKVVGTKHSRYLLDTPATPYSQLHPKLIAHLPSLHHLPHSLFDLLQDGFSSNWLDSVLSKSSFSIKIPSSPVTPLRLKSAPFLASSVRRPINPFKQDNFTKKEIKLGLEVSKLRRGAKKSRLSQDLSRDLRESSINQIDRSEMIVTPINRKRRASYDSFLNKVLLSIEETPLKERTRDNIDPITSSDDDTSPLITPARERDYKEALVEMTSKLMKKGQKGSKIKSRQSKNDRKHVVAVDFKIPQPLVDSDDWEELESD
ncbi:hypothetical protein RCL1_006545 [Eukaryota sp. TZLM3-RCL]